LEKDVAIAVFSLLGFTSRLDPEFPNNIILRYGQVDVSVPLHWKTTKVSPLNLKRLQMRFAPSITEDELWSAIGQICGSRASQA
jgi:hypothetical protein